MVTSTLCLPCDDTCLECDTSPDNCSLCDVGYYFTPAYATVDNLNNPVILLNHCVSCLVDSRSNDTLSGCLHCSSTIVSTSTIKSCLQCALTFCLVQQSTTIASTSYLYNVCRRCIELIDNCYICRESVFTAPYSPPYCTQCEYGYALISAGSICVPCADQVHGCRHCIDPGHCITCYQGYYLTDSLTPGLYDTC